MSFWNTSDNQSAASVGGQFETGGGDMTPIPANTTVLAAPDEAKWEDHNGDYHIALRWVVLQPKEYANRKIFHKLRVEDKDPKKADKAKRMLAAIDHNAGGKLAASGEKPTDESMTRALVNKPMMLKLQVWEIDKDDGTKAAGNWVSAVAPRSGNAAAPQAQPAAPVDEDIIPF